MHSIEEIDPLKAHRGDVSNTTTAKCSGGGVARSSAFSVTATSSAAATSQMRARLADR